MSASPLNVASLPGLAGPAAAPGAATGIAQQATQAAQAQGPLAGFEALLAAFFSGQGTAATPGAATATPGAASAAAQGPVAQLPGQALPGAKPADGKSAKAGGVSGGGKGTGKNDAAAGATPGKAVAAGDVAVDAATLALLTPTGVQTQIQPQVEAAAGQTGAQQDARPDAGPGGKPAGQPATLAQLATAVLGADGKPVKATAALAGQATATPTPDAAAPTVPADDGKAATPSKPQAAAPATSATLPPAPTLTNQAAAVTTQALPSPPAQPVAIPTKAGDTAATPGATKDRDLEVKTTRVQGAPTGPPPSGSATKTESAQAAAAAAGNAGKDADGEARDPGATSSDAKAAPASDAGQPASFTSALNAQAATNAPALAHAATPLRAVPQTVANLAAQMVRKLNGRSTRFDVELEPAGLGKVDVRVQIDAAGKMTAALNFDNQQAASELKARAGELQRAMEQAGFDLSGGLSFDVSGQGGQAQGQGEQSSPGFRGRAFQAVLEGGADSAVVNPQTTYRQASAAGVDIRI